MNESANLQFDKTSLEEVAEDIGKRHRVTVQLDRKALDDAALPSNTPITCSLQGVPLKTALRVVLGPLGLTYDVANEVLLITTAEVADSKLDARTYPVRDLISEPDGAGGTIVDADSLMEAIKSTVAPTSWDDVGGPGSLDVYKGTLVVSQSWHGHELVAEWLSNLRKAHRNKNSRAVIGVPPAQQKLREALRKPVQLKFEQTPLNQALANLAKRHKLPIHLDTKALDDAAMDPATPVSLNAPGVSLSAALSLLLHDARLEWVPLDGIVVVTTREIADITLETRVYPVADLVARQDGLGEATLDFDSLIETLKSACAPTTWDDAGGAGSLDVYSDALMVSQTFQVHQLIEQTLAALRRAHEAQASGPLKLTEDELLRQARGGQANRPAKAPVSILLGDQAPAQRLGQALEKRVTLNATNMPLNKVLAELSRQVGAPIVLDRPALDDAAILPDKPCTIQVEAAPLKSVLRRSLDFGLTYDFHYETLWVTTREVDDTQLTTRAYPVRDLITYTDDAGSYLDAEPLMELIKSTVAPTTWDDAGGAGSLDAMVGGCDVLLCSQTSSIQQEIEATLTAMRKAIASQEPPAQEKLDPNPVLKVYRLTGGLSNGGTQMTSREGRPSEKQLAQLIRDLIEPQTWDKKQGLFIGTVKGALAVRNTPRVQLQVASLLKKLHEWTPNGQPTGLPGLNLGRSENPGQAIPQFASAAPRDALMQFGGPYFHPFNPALVQSYRSFRIRVLPPGYDEKVQLEVFHLGPAVVVTEGEKSKTLTPAPDKVAALVEQCVAPKTWQSAGGQGFIHGLPGVIVVRQPGAVQRQVAKLLLELGAWDRYGVRIDNAGQLNADAFGPMTAPPSTGPGF